MRFQMLGPLRIVTGTGRVAVAAEQQRVVLALLLVEAGQAVSTERLVDAVWGDRPPRTAVNTVHAYVLRLRRLVGAEGLVTRGHGYQLVVDDGDLDATVFERLVRLARQERDGGDLESAGARLTGALELWRGPVLADVPPSPALATQVAYLEELRLDAQEDRAGVLLDLARHAQVVTDARLLVESCPLRERRWELLMLALSRCGRRAEALDAYQQARRRLQDELGLEPGRRLQELQRAILAGAPEAAGGDGRAAPATPPMRVVPAQLPAVVAGFVGRGAELARLDGLLQTATDPSTAAVVITAVAGTAGVGKTALAVHWAYRVRDRFPDGQLYINLRGYADRPPVEPIDALAQFLRALGVPPQQVPSDMDEASSLYRSLLADRRTLVLLDNASQPEQVRPLLPGGAGCVALVTGRDRLAGLVARDGAVLLDLETLTPGESVALLARMLGADRVAAEPAAAAELAHLCGRLPLALRITAASLTARPRLSIADQAARLARDRLAGLDMDDPQDGVRAAFELSYCALPDGTRRLFRRLGLVPGPTVTAPAATALSAGGPEVAVLLERLASAHLVELPAPGRYSLHDLLRQYAAELAAAEDPEPERRAALDRLYRYYLDQVTAAQTTLYPEAPRLPIPDPAPCASFPGEAEAMSWLDLERPNLVAAVCQAADQGGALATRAWQLGDALRGYLFHHVQVADWDAIANAALVAADAAGDPGGQASAHVSAGLLRTTQGRYRDAIDHHESAVTAARRARWVEGEAMALNGLGVACAELGRLDRAAGSFAQALAIDRASGQLTRVATRLGNLGSVQYMQGQLGPAAENYAQALTLHRKAGSRVWEAHALADLGGVEHYLGQLDTALASLDQASALLREVSAERLEASVIRKIAAVHRDAGRLDVALEFADRAVRLAAAIGVQKTEVDALATRAAIRDGLGDHRLAIAEYQQAVQAASQTGSRFIEAEALVGLAISQLRAGQPDRATEQLRRVLALAREDGYRIIEGYALIGLAATHLSHGNAAPAIDQAGRAIRIHTETGHRLGQAQGHLVAGSATQHIGDHSAADAHLAAARELLTWIGADPDLLAAMLLLSI